MADRLEEYKAAIEEWTPTVELMQWAVAEIERLRAYQAAVKKREAEIAAIAMDHITQEPGGRLRVPRQPVDNRRPQ